jgi:hypothetical protein
MNADVTLIDDSINCQVVQIKGRKYPGVVIQGDSLGNLVDLAGEIVRLIESADLGEARDTAFELHGLLAARLQVYNDAVFRLQNQDNSQAHP